MPVIRRVCSHYYINRLGHHGPSIRASHPRDASQPAEHDAISAVYPGLDQGILPLLRPRSSSYCRGLLKRPLPPICLTLLPPPRSFRWLSASCCCTTSSEDTQSIKLEIYCNRGHLVHLLEYSVPLMIRQSRDAFRRGMNMGACEPHCSEAE